jgi:predicted transposase/invertase (TIGR01784 family)
MNLSLTNDYIFRHVFSREENRDLLLDLINTIMTDSGFPPAVRIELRNPANLRDADWGRQSVLDIRAEDDKGRHFDIEIQVEHDAAFARRSLYYWAQIYTRQLKKGEAYHHLRPVVCINILDFQLFPKVDQAHNCFMATEIHNPDLVLTEDLVIHFIELSKPDRSENHLAHWKRLIGGLGREGEDLTIVFKQEPEFLRVKDEYERCIQDPEARSRAESRERWRHDQATREYQARLEGLKEGVLKGKTEGKQEGKLEDAAALKRLGVPVETICAATGLIREAVDAL